MAVRLALKVDADTDRGTRIGVPNLVADCAEFGAAACFLFSLGPDQTGRAITRVLRPGFFSKVSRTSVVQLYGIRTLLNGTLLPAPHIGRRNTAAMRAVRDAGFEVGIHCYIHYRWQDYLDRMDLEATRAEFVAARAEFLRVFGEEARTAGAAGWQSNSRSREVYDEAGLLYSSDTRGAHPFFPRIGGTRVPHARDPEHASDARRADGPARVSRRGDRRAPHVAARAGPAQRVHPPRRDRGHGPARRSSASCSRPAGSPGVEFVRLDDEARRILADRAAVPVCDQLMAPIDGRSGLVATQAPADRHRVAAMEGAPQAARPPHAARRLEAPEGRRAATYGSMEELIPLSARALQSAFYSRAQIEAALGAVFGVDRQLVRDGTYLVVEQRRADRRLRGMEPAGLALRRRCGAQARGPGARPGDGARADPRVLCSSRLGAARDRQRASWPPASARLRRPGFGASSSCRRWPGKPLYARFGYRASERYDVGLAGGLALPVVRMERALSGPVQAP